MTCDLAIMGESAYVYQAFLPVGMVPDGGATWHLVRTLGYKRAMQIIIEAEKIPASQCVELGVANKVVSDDDLLVAAQVWAEKLAEGAPIPQRFAKRLLQQAMDCELGTTISAEATAQDTCVASKDCQIAIEAFFAKAKPVFTGT
jgi:2-(1,2-epoxy-1,2-dihydrophenyl)acetyl-CoA isomerase